MSGWISKVYYDVLARVVPGSVVLLGLVYLEDGPVRGINYVFRSMTSQEGSLALRFAVGLLAAYLIGLIIGELGELLAGRVLERRDADREAVIARECLDEHNGAMHAAGRRTVDVLHDQLPSAAVMSEELAVVDNCSGGRLLALKAERRLCLVLSFGLLLLGLGNLLVFTADLVPKRLLVEGVLLLSLLVFWRRSSRLHSRVVRQTCFGWLMNVSLGRTTDSGS